MNSDIIFMIIEDMHYSGLLKNKKRETYRLLSEKLIKIYTIGYNEGPANCFNSIQHDIETTKYHMKINELYYNEKCEEFKNWMNENT